jgi:hypothetical protein
MATYNNIAYGNIGTLDGAGGHVLLQTLTASSSANLSFTSGIDDTYKEYIFKCIDIHPATDNVAFQINFRDGGTDYDATKTTTFFDAGHSEDDSTVASIAYDTGADVAQGTGNARLSRNQGNGNDESCAGFVNLYDPSSTTFVKHFQTNFQGYDRNNIHYSGFGAGYCNVTAAIDGVQFAFSSGNIDSGTIKMYGVL